MSANENSGAPKLERELRASVAAFLPRGMPPRLTMRLTFLKAAAARHMRLPEATTFAASVLAAVELGCDLREAAESTIAAWRVARRGGGALWDEAVNVELLLADLAEAWANVTA